MALRPRRLVFDTRPERERGIPVAILLFAICILALSGTGNPRSACYLDLGETAARAEIEAMMSGHPEVDR